MKTSTPEVTVLIPTRDRSNFLSDAVRSALAQEDVDVEVLVIDDGSTDDTAAVLEALDDARVRVLSRPSSGGVALARNEAIAKANGAWVAFLDDDDLWAPNKLRRQLDAVEQTGAVWCFCDIYLVSPALDAVRVDVTRDAASTLAQLLEHNVVQAGNSTVLVRSDVLTSVGGYDETFNSPWDLWIRLAQVGPPAIVAEPLAAYRRHANTFIAGNKERALAEAHRLAEKHHELSAQYGKAFDIDTLAAWLDSERGRSLRAAALAAERSGKRAHALRLQGAAFAQTRSRRDLRTLVGLLVGTDVRRLLRRDETNDGTSRESLPRWLVDYVRQDAL